MSADPGRQAAFKVNASRRSVSLSLNADLVTRVERVTPNLSETVETLLSEFLATRSPERNDLRDELEAVVDAVNGLHERHGFLSDDFSKL